MRTLRFRAAVPAIALGALLGAQSATVATAQPAARGATGELIGRGASHPSMSADGRFIAFQSAADDLAARDFNGASDVFVYDEATGGVALASTGPGALRGDGPSVHPAISADGRFVAFASDATNFVAPWLGPEAVQDVTDGNGVRDIFVFDRLEGRLGVVSVAGDGRLSNGESDFPSISGDGRFVVFQSRATNLGADGSGGRWQVYRHDRLSGETSLVSMDLHGQPAPGESTCPVISADGWTVAFESTGALTNADANGLKDVYVRRGPLADPELVSLAPAGGAGDGASGAPSISADGLRIAFESAAGNLVGKDTNRLRDVFVRDLALGTTRLLSFDMMHGEADGTSGSPAISGDGRLVAFQTAATLAFRDESLANHTMNVVIADVEAPVQALLNAGLSRENPADFGDPTLSHDGSYAVFVAFSPFVNPEQGPEALGLRGACAGMPVIDSIDFEIRDSLMTLIDSGSLNPPPGPLLITPVQGQLQVAVVASPNAACSSDAGVRITQIATDLSNPPAPEFCDAYAGGTCAAPGAPVVSDPVQVQSAVGMSAALTFCCFPQPSDTDDDAPSGGSYQFLLQLQQVDAGNNVVGATLLRQVNILVDNCPDPIVGEPVLSSEDFCFDSEIGDRFTPDPDKPGEENETPSDTLQMFPGEGVTLNYTFALSEPCDTGDPDTTASLVRLDVETTQSQRCPDMGTDGLDCGPSGTCFEEREKLPCAFEVISVTFTQLDAPGTVVVPRAMIPEHAITGSIFPIEIADPAFAALGVDADTVTQASMLIRIEPTFEDVGIPSVVRYEALDSSGESSERELQLVVSSCPVEPLCELTCFTRTCDGKQEDFPCPVGDKCNGGDPSHTFEVVPAPGPGGAPFTFRITARYPAGEDESECSCIGGTVRLELLSASPGAPALTFGASTPGCADDGTAGPPDCDLPGAAIPNLCGLSTPSLPFIDKTLDSATAAIIACVSGVALDGQARSEPYRYVFRVTDLDTCLTSECCVDLVICPPPVCDIPLDLVTVDGDPPIVNMDGSILVLPGQKLVFTALGTVDCRSLGLSLDEFGSTRDLNPSDMAPPIAYDPFPAMSPDCMILSTDPPTGPPASIPVSIGLDCGATGPRTISATATCTFPESYAGSVVVIGFRATDSCGRSDDMCDLTIRFAVPPECSFKNVETCEAAGRISVTPGTLIDFDINFESDVLSDLNWSVKNLPTGATLTPPPPPVPPAMGAFIPSPASTNFEWTPTDDDKGLYTVTFNVMDEFGQMSDCVIEIEVCNPPSITIRDQTPLCVSTDRIQAAAGQQVSFKADFDSDCRDMDPRTDLDIKWSVEWFKGETLIAAPTGAVFMPPPSGMAFVNSPFTSMFTWTPTVSDKDMIFTVRITAMDECGRMSTRDITIAVCNAPSCIIADIVPEPCQSTGRVEVVPGQTVMFDFRSTAGCSDKQVTWCVEGLPASKDIDDVFEPDPPCGDLVNAPLESVFTWTPGVEDKGVHTITITVTDECGRESECDIDIAVCNPPQCSFKEESPTCDAAGGGINAMPGEEVTFKVNFTETLCGGDPVDRVYTYSVEGLPADAVLMPPPGELGEGLQVMFTWTPGTEDKGDTDITFTVMDDCGRSSDCEITVGVCNAPVCEIRDINKDVCSDDTLPGVYLVHAGQKISATLFASSECEVNRLNWSAAFCLDGADIPIPAGVTFDPPPPAPGVFFAPPVDSEFCWIPTLAQVSGDVYTLKFMVEDECGRPALCEIDILVCAPPVCEIDNVEVLDAEMMVVETIDPFEDNCAGADDPIRLMIGETIKFDFCAEIFCPCGDATITYSIFPPIDELDDPGTITFPDPTPVGDQLCSTFEWTIGSDAVGEFEITFSVTDSLDKPPVQCCIKIFIPSPCVEDCPNDTDDCTRPYFIDHKDCGPYFSGVLEPSEAPGCEPDTYLVLFDKFVQYINENDNGSNVGNGKASALYGVTIANGLVNDGGTLSLRVGVTGYPDGRTRPFEGLFQNAPHHQIGEFQVKITFYDAGGAPILNGVILPLGLPYMGPTFYRDEFITGAEAFKLSFTAPAGTASADVEIDNTVGMRDVCDDVDFIRYINLVPFCEYCITQSGGLDMNCERTDIRIGWFDKDCELISSDCDSGPFGQAEICVPADNNGVILIGITGCDDEDFDGLSDAPAAFTQRAPPVCPDPPPGHGVCGCYTLCIMPNQPHGLSGAEGDLASSEIQSIGRSATGRTAEELGRSMQRGDINFDGLTDTSDLALLMSNWGTTRGR